MVATGMRVGELCKLSIDDVSPDGAVLRIQGKGARDRIAYITDAKLLHELHEIRQSRQKSEIGAGMLFVNRYGSRLRPQSVRSKLRRLANDAGLTRRVTPHMLRHTAATLLIETGVDIRFVQRLLGHSSIATTEIYTHVSDEALRLTLERANVLGALSPR
jgi:integrase/recombinase XerD